MGLCFLIFVGMIVINVIIILLLSFLNIKLLAGTACTYAPTQTSDRVNLGSGSGFNILGSN